MGEALMPRRGGGNSGGGGGSSGGGVKTGWAKPTTGETFAHDDFVGAKVVVILAQSVSGVNYVLQGYFEPFDYDSMSGDASVTYLDDYGDIGCMNSDPGIDIDPTAGVLYTWETYPFDTTVYYNYIAIY